MTANHDSDRPADEAPGQRPAGEDRSELPAEAPQEVEMPEGFLDDVVAEASGAPSPLRQELSDANDRLLRAQAELDNVRKRAQREVAEQRKYGALPLLRDLVGVLDNLQRALQAARSDGADGAGRESSELSAGVEMVANEMQRVLAQHDCLPVPGAGAAFDPNVHEALAQQPSQEYPSGTVMLVHQVGYRLHDRVVRPAQVIVSSGPSQPSSRQESG
jgi:molecular chaperone GrpE